MEPTVTVLATLGKVFAAGALSYLGEAKQGFDETDVSAISAVLEALGSVHGLTTAKKPTRMTAVHTALVLQAFGMAFAEHWAGDERMAPGLKEKSWVHRVLRSGDQAAREKEIQTRLKVALGWLLPEFEKHAAAERLSAMHALHPDPMATPIYQALYTAFADERFEGSEGTALLDMRREGARLQFEGAFQMAYAELLVTTAGQELGRFLLAVDEDRPRQLRRRLMEDWSISDRRHVFGTTTPGVPMMPLGFMYVEPDGLWGQMRKPLRGLIGDLLGTHRIVLVRGDFGMGKSLTARMLAKGWAEQYMRAVDKTSTELVLPVFIKCARDFQRQSFEATVREALRNQAEGIGISLRRSDEALAMPPDTMRVVYLVDGLDEVALSHMEVEQLFRELKGATRHRVVVFSRKGALPAEEKLKGIPVIDVQPFRENDQIGAWLDRWNRISGREPIAVEELKKAKLLELATTPILLFMIAITWNSTRIELGETSQVAIYEHFFQQIAAGKCKHDRDRHPRVAEASEKLREKLRERGYIGRNASLEEAMLLLMSRIAWEHRRREARDEYLDLQDVNNLLRDALDLRGDPQAQEMIRMGALLVLQADLRDQNHTILFGHKSFREFLTARWWADRLGAIIQEREESRQKTLERDLYGAILLQEDDRSFEFLMAILNGVQWKEKERKKIGGWAERAFLDERPGFDKDEEARLWRDDQRVRLRHAALAIRCSLNGLKPLKAKTSPMRSMLGWFWSHGTWVRLYAPGISAEGMSLPRADLAGADLRSANLKHARLSHTDLLEANLSGANLCGAILAHANLSMADLSRADLSGAELDEADLGDAILSEADLSEADLSYANLIEADLRGAKLRWTIFSGADLRDADLSEADLSEADLSGADLSGADLSGAKLIDADFTNADLSGVNLKGAVYSQRTRWPIAFDPSSQGACEVDTQ
ncbi:pentapeptide repeat-containing protein [Polyangium sp. y55x31]|uniref:pentapeptide repeat-containing protein n=1 Tax=Polyangium sp. y55x31 TaxID=3042688 RepID=UPI0024821F35|nr:pentapeptide repeat-containing protein [Polyangium sp. y55x31]MDI1483192.1 pentapeptide repeat-containing protein [Polyangium sp. y55x31]